MPQIVQGYTIDLEGVEETLASLDGHAAALAQLTEKLGRTELGKSLSYMIQLLEEHHATLKWHLGLPLHRNASCVAALLEGGAAHA